MAMNKVKVNSDVDPGIIFSMEREAGNQILEVEGLKAVDEDGTLLFDNLSFNVGIGPFPHGV